MSRETFMKELEYLLQDIGEEERADALAYYRDYLDEAGPEREEQALAEFGSPERVAAMIRASIDGNMEEGGEFTETGYGDERFKDPGYQVQKRYDVPDISPEPEKTGGETAGRKGETPRKPESGLPFSRTCPPHGRSYPASSLHRVVFPRPLGPRSPTRSPGCTVRLTACNTGGCPRR